MDKPLTLTFLCTIIEQIKYILKFKKLKLLLRHRKEN